MGSTALLSSVLGTQKKSNGQETEAGGGTRPMWVLRRVDGISPERANKQTPARARLGRWGNANAGTGCVGTWGSPACSGRAGEAAAAGQRERGGRFPEPRAVGTPEPGSAGPGGRGPRAEAGAAAQVA